MRKSEVKILKQRFDKSTEENYLKLVLQSYSEYNHKARLDIAKILYQEFLQTPENEGTLNLRKNLFAEIFNKMTQSLEDSALLAVMFMDRNKTPLEHFTSNNNKVFYNFFSRARRGLSNNQILRMYGLEPAEKLLEKGLIDQRELEDFQNEIDLLLNSPKGEKRRWKGLGKVYTQPHIELQTGKRSYRKKSNVVSVYHNIKHAYKVLIPNQIYKEIWFYDDNDPPSIAVIEEYTELSKRVKRLSKELNKYKKRKMIFLGTFEVTKKTVKEIYSRIHPQAQTIKFISDLQLGKIDDPAYPVREFRFAIYNSKHPQPKHFEPCPCGSGIKYKKCHRNKDYDFSDIIFSKV